MDYELAKKLNKAGFPIPIRHKHKEWCKALGCYLKDGIGRKKDIHIPIFEEVIEVIDEEYVGLTKLKTGYWAASVWLKKANENGLAEEATDKTPLKAIVKLFLAINP